MIKKLVGLLAIAVIIVGCCGCMENTASNANTEKETIKITDILGRDVEVPKEVIKSSAMVRGH